jgi:hypothetical protein
MRPDIVMAWRILRLLYHAEMLSKSPFRLGPGRHSMDKNRPFKKRIFAKACQYMQNYYENIQTNTDNNT